MKRDLLVEVVIVVVVVTVVVTLVVVVVVVVVVLVVLVVVVCVSECLYVLLSYFGLQCLWSLCCFNIIKSGALAAWSFCNHGSFSNGFERSC